MSDSHLGPGCDSSLETYHFLLQLFAAFVCSFVYGWVGKVSWSAQTKLAVLFGNCSIFKEALRVQGSHVERLTLIFCDELVSFCMSL